MTGCSKSLGQSLALSQSSSMKDRGPKLLSPWISVRLDDHADNDLRRVAGNGDALRLGEAH